MRRCFAPLAALAAVAASLSGVALVAGTLVAATPAVAAELAERLPWDGFAVGSSVHQRTTTTMSVEGVPPQTSDARQTLVKVTDEAYTVKYETKVGDTWMGTEVPFPRKATGVVAGVEAPKPEELGDEIVAVEGKEYACKKVRTTSQGMVTTTWTHATHGVLKVETKGPGHESSTLVTKLAVKVKAGDREVDARESVSTSKASGADMKTTTWRSEAVPGGSVRTEIVTEMPGMKTTVLTETVAFEAK